MFLFRNFLLISIFLLCTPSFATPCKHLLNAVTEVAGMPKSTKEDLLKIWDVNAHVEAISENDFKSLWEAEMTRIFISKREDYKSKIEDLETLAKTNPFFALVEHFEYSPEDLANIKDFPDLVSMFIRIRLDVAENYKLHLTPELKNTINALSAVLAVWCHDLYSLWLAKLKIENPTNYIEELTKLKSGLTTIKDKINATAKTFADIKREAEEEFISLEDAANFLMMLRQTSEKEDAAYYKHIQEMERLDQRTFTMYIGAMVAVAGIAAVVIPTLLHKSPIYDNDTQDDDEETDEKVKNKRNEIKKSSNGGEGGI